MSATVTEVNQRFGTTGLQCLVHALGRLATTELAARADRDDATVAALVEGWAQHKLEQHAEETEDGA